MAKHDEKKPFGSPPTNGAAPWPKDQFDVNGPGVLAYGTRVEDANERRIAPGSLRVPPKALLPQHRCPWRRPGRTVSVIRHGIDWLRRLLLRGRLWSRVWLLPEPWPEPKPNLEVTRHATA